MSSADSGTPTLGRTAVMARATDYETTVEADTHADAKTHQAYELLHIAFAVAPIVTGLDKFLHLLTNWDKYLAPQFSRLAEGTPLASGRLMPAVGLIEVAAGIVVALRPRIGAYIVAAWLLAIIVNLVMVGGFLDVALRDLGLFLGALALGRLAAVYDVHHVRRRVERQRPAAAAA
jgi:hypothetical protein